MPLTLDSIPDDVDGVDEQLSVSSAESMLVVRNGKQCQGDPTTAPRRWRPSLLFLPIVHHPSILSTWYHHPLSFLLPTPPLVHETNKIEQEKRRK